MHHRAERCISRLLSRVLPEDVAEALVGDLVEEHALRRRTEGAWRAALWYCAQVAGSVVPLLATALRRRATLFALALGGVGYWIAAAAERAARDAVAPVATHTALDAVPVLIVHLCTIVLAAYAAERVRAGAALALGALVAAAAVLQLFAPVEGMPFAYAGALLIAGPAAALAGEVLWERTSRRTPAPRRRRTVA